MKERVYAAYLKNKEQLLKSASGGMYTALSDLYLKNGNAVVCCLYNNDKDRAELTLVYDVDKRNEARGSKYIQSSAIQIYNESFLFLKNNPEKKIMFFGTGCQAIAFLKFMKLKGVEERIITIDIICHGVPSPKIWKEYIRSLKKKVSGNEVKYLSFRDKSTGWKTSSSVVYIDQKKIDIKRYKKYLYGPMTLRPSCYECPFARIDRDSDITIGDFWGIENHYAEMFNKNGVSIVIVHSNKGQEIFEAIKENIEWKETDINKSLQPNLQKPTARSAKREQFMKDYKKYGFQKIMKKYADDSVVGKIRRKINL